MYCLFIVRRAAGVDVTDALLLNPRRDFFQDADESRALAFANQLIKVTLVPARAARHVGENLFSGGRKVQAICAAVSIHAGAFDQTTPYKIFDHWRKARFVAAVGERKFGLADAWVAGDQRQGSEPARTFADLLRMA